MGAKIDYLTARILIKREPNRIIFTGKISLKVYISGTLI
jgi:hypothetical protein